MPRNRILLPVVALLLAACASPTHVPLAPDGLRAEEPGDSDKQREVKPAPDKDTELDRAADEAGEIIVTGHLGKGVPVVPVDSVGSRNVFGPKQIRESGARDVNDLVQNIPAISTRPYNGGEASAPSFSMRGLPDDGLTEFINIMVDGVPASPMPYGWTAFSFLPVTPDRLFAIDYIRGAHSVRYSPNTVSGVLNFLTAPIPQEPTLNIRTTAGNKGFLSTMVTAGGRWDNFGLGGTFVDRRGDGYRDMGEFDQRDYNGKFRWDIEEGRWVAASVSYMEDCHKAPGGLTQAEFDANRFGNSRPLNQFDGYRTVADVVYHDDFDGTGWWEGFLHGSDTKRTLIAQRPHFGTATDLLTWTDDSYFWAAGGRVHKQLGTHRLYGGIRFHREWIPSWKIWSQPFPSGAPALTRDSSYSLSTLSVHLDDTWKATDRLTVNAGARIEWVPSAKGDDNILNFHFDDDFFKVLPGVGASYVIVGKTAVFANYFEGFRAPQVWGYGSTMPGTTLDFEDSTQFEAGVRSSDWNGVGGAATVWRTDYDNFGVFFSGFYENLGRIVAQGVDLEVNWDVGQVWESVAGLNIGGSLTLQDSELRSGPDAGNETPYAWGQKAAWYCRYTRSGWTFLLGGTFVGESFSDSANTSMPSADGTLGVNPSRVLWDARVSKTVALGEKGDLELAVGATNLFDHDWYVHSRGGFFGGGLVAGPPLQGYASLDFVLNW